MEIAARAGFTAVRLGGVLLQFRLWFVVLSDTDVLIQA